MTPELMDNLKFIKSMMTHNLWRPKPADPYIYISFSIDEFKRVYPHTFSSLKVEGGESVRAFNLETIRLFKKIIQHSAFSITPIKYLSRQLSIAEIRDKNVVFIIARPTNLLQDCHAKRPGGETTSIVLTRSHKDGTLFTELTAKFILLPHLFSANELHNAYKYIFLHEMLHALVGAKHFRKHDENDVEPFSDLLTCEDSLMSYPISCPIKLKNGSQVPRPKLSEDCENIEMAYADMEVVLKPLDLVLIDNFTKEFQLSHEAAAPKSWHLTLVENVLSKFTQYIGSLTDCTNYFPGVNSTAHLNYWNKSSVFFSPNLGESNRALTGIGMGELKNQLAP